MIVTYDNVAKAAYIELKIAKVASTIEFAPETLIDLDRRGNLIGVELLHPNQSALRKIAKKFKHPELSKVHARKLFGSIS